MAPLSFGATSAELLAEITPRQDLAHRALRKAAEVVHLSQPELSPGNRLRLTLDESTLHAFFGADRLDLDRGAELSVPQFLRDEIEFAYVPSRPDFFAPTLFPPPATFHHLGLIDVANILGARRLHQSGRRGMGVRIAVTDSGFYDHPYLQRAGFDVTPVGIHPPDVDGHGTGVLANLLAVAPEATVLTVVNDVDSATALEMALAEGPHVISSSWGFNCDTTSLADLKVRDPNRYNEVVDISRIIDDAVASRIVVIFAGGNGHKAFPASHPGVIAVGGVYVHQDETLHASDYASSFGSQLFPGRNVPDLCGLCGKQGKTGHIMLPVTPHSRLDALNLNAKHRGRGWGVWSGTSSAAPQVAGVVALMLSAKPTLSPHEVRRLLIETATQVNQGKSAHGDPPPAATGGGLVDAHAAVNAV